MGPCDSRQSDRHCGIHDYHGHLWNEYYKRPEQYYLAWHNAHGNRCRTDDSVSRRRCALCVNRYYLWGDLLQTNGAAVVVAESGSTTSGFDTLITQNNFKSDNTPQPTQSINATFANEDGDPVEVTTEELTIE